ncbi:MAG: hypothetical protein KGJ87_01070 [Planctomycetota bacterium]|nr:hypothetical protein [Planctomycetota bacterium]MDE2215747.1 hypothetical protein [Planctomycetota bacterium]
MQFKELLTGIDSLYVSYKGTLKESVRIDLLEKKALAQSENEKEQALATVTVDDHYFAVKDRGTKYYSYILEDNWYHIQISTSERKITPTVYVKISSELLTCLGLNESLNKLREIVNKLLSGVEGEKMSRADLFVDFVTDKNLEKIEKQSWITRAEDTRMHWKRDRFTGWSIGEGGEISARLYDKTLEIEKSHKYYLKEIWDKQDWDKEQKVWRFEFQLRREFLEQMSISTFSDLVSKINDTWRYCTHNWLRLIMVDKTINRTRWRTNPLWEKIQKIRFLDGNYTGVTRFIDKSRIPSDKMIYLCGMGPITAFSAKEGYDDINEDTINNYLTKAKKFLKEYTKGSDIYKDDEDYLKTKIGLKKKKYNKALSKTVCYITNLSEKPQP